MAAGACIVSSLLSLLAPNPTLHTVHYGPARRVPALRLALCAAGDLCSRSAWPLHALRGPADCRGLRCLFAPGLHVRGSPAPVRSRPRELFALPRPLRMARILVDWLRRGELHRWPAAIDQARLRRAAGPLCRDGAGQRRLRARVVASNGPDGLQFLDADNYDEAVRL